jgi:hypothetical protein
MTKTTVQVGPFGLYFSNSNPKLGLPLHTHYAEVSICFDAVGDMGPPVIAETQDALRTQLQSLVREPFIGMTNEQVSQLLFDSFDRWVPRGGDRFDVAWLELAVRCVRDDLGHAESFTRYRTTSCRLGTECSGKV